MRYKTSQYENIEKYPAERLALDNLHTHFAENVMYGKLIQKLNEGYHGWDDPTSKEGLIRILKKNMERSDWVDVANIAMFLWNLEQKEK